ncbi:unnamed protein product [Lymnaea stagnalis]|uniref:Ubiquitin carboxyl-terminal hydrolase MINDY n=1 Tax=Lymnaea stagnalis TaxID=6523 RepID=A0AAV2I1U3_LYMST
MASSNKAVEAATASLVREYLSRKGLKETLEKMDKECPRNEFSISNRQTLMKHIHLEKLMKKNKEEKEPLQTMLEIMTKGFMDRQPLTGRQTSVTSEGSSLKRQNSDINFSPQANQPLNGSPLANHTKSSSTTNNAKKEKSLGDLVVDDDVEGETLIGSGMSGLMSVDPYESPPLQFSTMATKTHPLSAKQRGAIISNNDDLLAKRQRNTASKLSPKLSACQQEQLKRGVATQQAVNLSAVELANSPGMSDGTNSGSSNISSPEFPFDSHKSKQRNLPKKPDDPPVSFEALLMKGEERANLLQRIGLDNRTKDNVAVEQAYKVENSSIFEEKKIKPAQKNNRTLNPSLPNSSKAMDIELGDIDDCEVEVGNINPKPSLIYKPLKVLKIPSSPLDLRTAIALKNIVLGSPSQKYSDEWLCQSFTFNDLPDIKYGLVQKKGGPCGVLAAVQACLLQEMLFGENKLSNTKFKNPSRIERSTALALGLSNIFWRAGNLTAAVVTVPSSTTHILSSTKFKQDGVTEKLSVYTFTNFEELCSFMIQSVSEFETEGCPGVILAMYSAILSRKTHQVRADFDEPEQSTIIGSHGYCTQELVNLFLTGRAVSNVFNDIERLEGSGLGDTVILKGISARSDIGLLSLFEHYKSCQVGTYYKTPKNPIWVVCSESHFSVLFAIKRDLVNDWKAERRFDLFYYDGLSNQQEEIKLTISTINQSYKPPTSEDDLVPPLEHCIRTKWADAEIDWNGYEPIL